jgi:hypothetical protein
MAIYEENDGGRLPLTWAQTRRMPITHLVRLRTCKLKQPAHISVTEKGLSISNLALVSFQLLRLLEPHIH